MWIQLLLQVQGFDDAVVIIGGFLHGGEIGEERRLHEVFQPDDALPDGDFLRRSEFFGGAKNVDKEEPMVWGAVTHYSGIVERDRGVARFREQRFVEARSDEVLSAAQHERGDGVRVGDRGGGGRFRGEHGVVRRRCARGVCLVN